MHVYILYIHNTHIYTYTYMQIVLYGMDFNINFQVTVSNEQNLPL